MMNREEALKLLKTRVQSDVLIKHCLASEAIMSALAGRLGRDPAAWSMAGLLHDLDFESTKDDPSRHGLETARILEEAGFPADMTEAIKAHNAEALGLARTTEFGKALTCAETITGLVVATALVQPDRKVASVKQSSVRKRMKEKAFARNVNREMIMLCEEIGVPLDEFIGLSIEAMKRVAPELGL